MQFDGQILFEQDRSVFSPIRQQFVVDGLPPFRDHVEAILAETQAYQRPGRNLHIKFVRQDYWIGLYWKTEQRAGPDTVYGNRNWLTRTYYLCLIPCFPIIWERYQQWER